MTAIYYPDLITRSPNGQWEFEARSPDNGTIRQKDGKRSIGFGAQYRSHQNNFRYRLIERTTQNVLWEKWQPTPEDSPGELIVGNNGFTVVRTHGFGPEIIIRDLNGATVIRIVVEPEWGNPNRKESARAPGSIVWVAEQLCDSSAGYYWSFPSWRYFVTVDNRSYFVWRTYWNARLVVDLTDRAKIDPSPKLARALDRAEALGVHKRLQQLISRKVEIAAGFARNQDDNRPVTYDELGEWIASADGAIQLAGIHRVHDCIPILRQFESFDLRSCSTGIRAIDRSCSLNIKLYRPIVRHALQRLGEQPGPYPPYSITSGLDENEWSIPQQIPDRAERLARIACPMAAEAVLQELGYPDHISQKFLNDEFIEQWEYDELRHGRWETKILEWNIQDRRSSLDAIIDAPTDYAISPERMLQIVSR